MAALIVSVIAILVAAAAAAFTFWQAFVAQRIRTYTIAARWRLEYRIRYSAPDWWYVHNDGGSAATDVRLTVHPLADRPEIVFSASGAVHAGQAARLLDTQYRGDPGLWWRPTSDDPKKFELGTAGDAGAKRFLRQWASISWTDESGRARHKKIPLY